MKRLVSMRALLIAMALLLAPVASALHLDLVPPAASFAAGDTVDVDVVVSGVDRPPSIGAFDLLVGFDPGLLAPIDVAFGLFLGDPALFQVLIGSDASAPGIVELAELSLLSPPELDALQPSAFTLATLSFEALADGTSAFSFIGTPRVDDAFGNKLPVSEPGMPGLVALALTALWRLRIRRRPALI